MDATQNQQPAPTASVREPLLGCAIGKKGIGKTYTTLSTIYKYVQGNPTAGIQGRKFLIFDVNDEFSHIKAIGIRDIPRFSSQRTPEIRRVRIWKENGKGKMTLDEMAEGLYYILDNYRGGGMLIEDITKYTGDNYSRDIIGAICTQRHMDCDIIIHFQTIGKLAHPKIWGNMNYIRMHKCTDTVKRHETKFAGEVEHLKILECLVDKQYRGGNTRFSAYLDLDKLKVKGAFSQEDFYGAIDEFIQTDYNRQIKPMLERRDENGNKLYNHATAVKEIRNRMYNEYYGNG